MIVAFSAAENALGVGIPRIQRRIPFAADAAGRTLSDEHTKHVLVFALADARRRFARNARAISSGGTVPE